MTMQAADALVKTHQINLAFGCIGTVGDTARPKTKSNLDPVAWELFVSQHLARIANSRKERATKAAVAAGIIFDPAKDPRPPGTNAVIWHTDLVRVSLAVATPVDRIDHAAWVAGLLAQKPGLAKLVRVLEQAHVVTARAAHTFSASLVTG